MHIETETVSTCPLCGGSDFSTAMRGSDFESGTGDYRIDRCGTCGLHFTNPRPMREALAPLYRSRGSPDFVPVDPCMDRLRAFSVRRSLKSVLKSCGRSDGVLDYGCGDGFFSLQLLRAFPGRTITACDFHSSPPGRLTNHPHIRYLTYQQHARVNDSYGLIFCRHVLEHLPDPSRQLHRTKRRLADDGILVVEVPNYRSRWRNIFSKYFSGLYLPRHLIHFEETTLRKILESFEMVRIEKTHTPLLGRSVGYRLHTAMANISFFGLTLFPFQVAVDRLFNTSSVLRAIVKKQPARPR